MKKLLLALLCAASPLFADEDVPVLPPAPPPVIENLVSDGTPYVEHGVAMAPLAVTCDFLGAKVTCVDGLVTVVKSFAEGAARTITFRLGGKTAQIIDGGNTRTVKLDRSPEARLGTSFAPAKFMVEILGGELEVDAESVPLKVKSGPREAVFAKRDNYNGSDAARVTLGNHVGRAISLRLSGPQKLRVELADGATLFLPLPPGLYYYQAGSSGMKTIKGARRLLAGRKTNWSWGR